LSSPWPSKDVLSGDDVLSGTRAAVCGGVTTVIDFIIPELGNPLQTLSSEARPGRSRPLFRLQRSHLHSRSKREESLPNPALVQQGFVSYKIFMAYQGFQLEDRDILR